MSASNEQGTAVTADAIPTPIKDILEFVRHTLLSFYEGRRHRHKVDLEAELVEDFCRHYPSPMSSRDDPDWRVVVFDCLRQVLPHAREKEALSCESWLCPQMRSLERQYGGSMYDPEDCEQLIAEYYQAYPDVVLFYGEHELLLHIRFLYMTDLLSLFDERDPRLAATLAARSQAPLPADQPRLDESLRSELRKLFRGRMLLGRRETYASRAEKIVLGFCKRYPRADPDLVWNELSMIRHYGPDS